MAKTALQKEITNDNKENKKSKDDKKSINESEEEVSFELEDLESETEKEDNGFIVDNQKKASWCLRKIRNLKDKQTDHKRLAEELISELKMEIREIESWRDKENEKLQSNIDFLENKLKNYMLKLREDDPELKTVNLPYGKLKLRKQRSKWKYNSEKLLEFLEGNYPDLVRVKKSPDKRKIKKKSEVSNSKAVLPTGEIIEGITVVDRPEKFKVDVSK